MIIHGFWNKLRRPFFILAPLAGVTDTVFRQIVCRYGKPDVLFTEFTSCDGLCSSGRKHLLPNLWFKDSERPIVAQIFGSKPENFYTTAQLIVELGFDGIDINTGCPDKCVEKQGAGAALLKNPELCKRIILATKKGAGSLPVSVKTRIGYDMNNINEWIKHLLEVEPALITIHARTRNEMSKVAARWDVIKTAVEIRNKYQSKTLIVGNGDVKNVQQGRDLAHCYNVDGIMIGRGIYGNPWLFNGEFNSGNVSNQLRLNVLCEHVKLFESTYHGKRNFAIMRKFFNSYVSGCANASQLKMNLMLKNKASEVEDCINQYHQKYDSD